MAKNRELTQYGSLVNVNDSSGQVGIANSVGINTTTPKVIMPYMFKGMLT